MPILYGGLEDFTVGSNTNIDSYTSGKLTFAYVTGGGSGSDIYVNATNDRVQGGASAGTERFAYVTNAGAPTGDYETTAVINQGNSELSLTVRSATGSINCYVISQTGANIKFYRVDNGSWTTLSTTARGLSDGVAYRLTCRVSGSGATVSLTAMATVANRNGVQPLPVTYDDTHANRKTSGLPGMHLYFATVDQGYLDEMYVDDLTGIYPVMQGASTLANGASVTLSFTGWGLQAGDLVVAAHSIGDNDDNNFSMALATSGYAQVPGTSDLFANDTQDTNLGVFYKVMGATPDTEVAVTGQAGPDACTGLAALVFRGVDTQTPFDVNGQGTTGLDTMHPDPPSISHNNPPGVVTLIAVASGHTLGGTGSFTLPSGYAYGFVYSGANDTSDLTQGMGYNLLPSSPENPAALTHSGTDSTAFSWCAATMALRPRVTSRTPSQGTATLTGLQPTVETAAAGTVVTPSTGTAPLTGLAPALVLVTAVATGIGAATLTGAAPIVSIQQVVSPAAQTLLLTGLQPSREVTQLVVPGLGALTLTGQTVSLQETVRVTPTTGTATLTGASPTVQAATIIDAGPGSLTVQGLAPSVLVEKSITPTSGSVLATGVAADVREASLRTPTQGALLLSGTAATVQTATMSLPTPGSLALTGLSPALTAGQTLTPSAGSATHTGHTPTSQEATLRTPSAGALLVTGAAPTVTTPTVVSPSTGAATLTGHAPGLTGAGDVVVSTQTVTAGGLAPRLALGVPIPAGQLFYTGLAPTVRQADSRTPTTGTGLLTGPAPVVREASTGTPTAGSLTLTGTVPLLTLTGPLEPARGTLTLTGHTPEVSAPEPEPSLVPAAGGDDAPRPRRERRTRATLFRDLDDTITALLHPAAEPAASPAPAAPGPAVLADVRDQLDRLQDLAGRTRRLQARVAALRDDLTQAEARWRAELDDEDLLMLL